MKNKLLWKLCWIVGVGAVLLFWIVDRVVQQTEQYMSFIALEHQQQLKAYGQEAEAILNSQGQAALASWLLSLQEREQTWAGVVTTSIKPLAKGRLPKQFVKGFLLGRSIEWKIHLYFKENPIMDIPFSDGYTHFLIRLPQRMRPGIYLPYVHLLLQIGLPFILLCFLSLVLYRHFMAPLQKLKKATQQFSNGNFDVRVKAALGRRDDELTTLAHTFDEMAERTGALILTQRQLLADLSHEVRTPLARIDMAVDCIEHNIHPEKALSRLRYEAATMRELVEDVLTLAWLNNEKPCLNKEDFDLVELISVICEDASFEYPERILRTELPEQAILQHSSQRALGQALENIIRNALRHTDNLGQVVISLTKQASLIVIDVKDHGPGVPVGLLNDIFRPFFQVDKSRLNHSEGSGVYEGKKRGGFGLGLALAQRQIAAVGGYIYARNHYQENADSPAGLHMIIELPQKA